MFRYSTVLWSSIKKSAKSSIAAAVGLWMAFQREWSTVRVFANDLKQADSRVAYYMRRAIILHPEWRNFVKINRYRIELPNHSIIEAVPIDPKGEAGGNDDLLIFSEIWGWKNAASLAQWTEATLSPLKFGKSLRWCETYSGRVGESPVLESLYEQGVTQGQCIDEIYEMYANRPARLFTLWNTKPRLKWQTKAYYAQEEAMLTPEEFLRVHRNQWVSSSAAFIPYEWWEACRDTQLPPLRPYDETVVAIDASTHDDGFAVVMVSRDPRQSDQPNRLILRDYRVWYPADYAHFDYEEPKAYLRHLAQHHNVVQFAFDPYQMKEVADTLHKEGLGSFKPFNQGQERAVADKMLYDTLRTRGLTHHTRQDFNEHIQNANRRDDDRDMMRIVKRNQNQKIDLVVALSMACKRARDVLLVGE